MYDSFNYENIKGIVPIYHFSCIFPERLEYPILLFFSSHFGAKEMPRLGLHVLYFREKRLHEHVSRETELDT